MKKFKDFYEAWWFLEEHSAFRYKDKESGFEFGYFQECLDIDVKKVDPKTREIEDDESLNTHVEVWLECGDYDSNGIPQHDIRLDCGGDTFEEAIIKLANLVKNIIKNK